LRVRNSTANFDALANFVVLRESAASGTSANVASTALSTSSMGGVESPTAIAMD
jgi:hypothetical protein